MPPGDYVRTTSRWLWHVVRIPAVMLLVILEPIVAFACGALALLGGADDALLRAPARAAFFRRVTMLAVSIKLCAHPRAVRRADPGAVGLGRGIASDTLTAALERLDEESGTGSYGRYPDESE